MFKIFVYINQKLSETMHYQHYAISTLVLIATIGIEISTGARLEGTYMSSKLH